MAPARRPTSGGTTEARDTKGTETASGDAQASFDFNVARNLAADLRADGARAVLTRALAQAITTYAARA